MSSLLSSCSSFHYSHSTCSKRSSLTVLLSGLYTYYSFLPQRKASPISSVWHYCPRVLALLSSSGYLGLGLNVTFSEAHFTPVCNRKSVSIIPLISPHLALFKSLIAFWNDLVYLSHTQQLAVSLPAVESLGHRGCVGPLFCNLRA